VATVNLQNESVLSLIIRQLASNHIFASFVLIIAVYTIYLVVISMHLYSYKKRHQTLPVHYKAFRLYSSNLISNSPSKKEKKFYRDTNKITVFFNSLLVLSFLLCLFFVFR
jgi:hypothetical protein